MLGQLAAGNHGAAQQEATELFARCADAGGLHALAIHPLPHYPHTRYCKVSNLERWSPLLAYPEGPRPPSQLR